MSNKSVRWDYSHFSFAAPVAHFQCVLICYLYCTSIKAKGTFHPRNPWGLGVTAFPWTSLQCLICNASPTAPLHYVPFASYCLCIASARLVPFSLPPLPLSSPSSSPSLSLSSVRLVPISSSLAVSCCADRAGHGSVAAVVFEVKVVLGIGKEYAMSPARLRCGKKKKGGGIHQWEEIPSRRIPAQRFLSDTSSPPPSILVPCFFPPSPLFPMTPPSCLSCLFGLVSLH